MAQQQATLTISGYVGSDPVNFSRNENAPACSLRIGSTSSYYHNEEKAWKERPTTWMTVKAYKSLASNVLKSVHKGDAIVVCGNLNTESWHKDGEDRSRVVLEATSIGHDLNRGISEFTKTSYARNRNVANAESKNKDYSENGDSQNQNFAMKNPMSSKSQSSIQDNSKEDSQENEEINDFGGHLDEEEYNDIEGGANDFQKVLIALNIRLKHQALVHHIWKNFVDNHSNIAAENNAHTCKTCKALYQRQYCFNRSIV